MYIAVGDLIKNSRTVGVSAFDHGLLYGLTIFESFRTYNRIPFLLGDHLTRMNNALRDLRISYIASEVKVQERINKLLDMNNLRDAYFRFIVTPGEQSLELPIQPYNKPVDILLIQPLEPYKTRLYNEGITLKLLNQRAGRVDGHQSFRTSSWFNTILGRRELYQLCEKKPSGWLMLDSLEGLQLTLDGSIIGGISSNVLFRIGNVWYTPAIETGALPGITRSWAIQTLKNEGIEVYEGFYQWEDILHADEIMLTNSNYELIPVNKLMGIDGSEVSVGNGMAGLITRKLLKKYSDEATSNCP
ncbi:aminotransferase class IV [Paenibacillus sp. MMS18-CY102]|uniref:aminotransferase class IV n=1 Tax=Paenibacillus sp. MMS18-CY102 TaxID=2682849 RepID=UPI00136551B2|nr:aminotransferase class IV [Paenibacillus sp. MMS18-CY102]MWC27605.1 4-amino-4-deoxychorismate lyase [Paenibacillus sp. MMS18-CY102]